MNRFFPHPLSLLRTSAWGMVGALALSSCSSMKPSEGDASVPEVATSAAETTPSLTATEGSLLDMGYDEAKAISAQHAEVGTAFRVAGDSVEVLKADAEGKPLKVRAKGHVFLEMPMMNRATALCEEATITVRDAHLKGSPILKQGVRVARASGKGTTFWVSDRLQVLGRFDLVKLDEPAASDAGLYPNVALAEMLRTPGPGMPGEASLAPEKKR